MTTIQGAVKVMISDGEGGHALHQVEREAAEEDERNGHHADQQRGLDPGQTRGKTLDKSSPVPYSEVVPVDMPPITASRHSGRKNQPGETASRPPT